jgi:hypothetical protein
MNKSDILAFLDAEIERLQAARQLLSGLGSARNGSTGAHRGARFGRPRRHMSAEVRRRISEAQKKRWAARKKAAK